MQGADGIRGLQRKAVANGTGPSRTDARTAPFNRWSRSATGRASQASMLVWLDRSDGHTSSVSARAAQLAL